LKGGRGRPAGAWSTRRSAKAAVRHRAAAGAGAATRQGSRAPASMPGARTGSRCLLRINVPECMMASGSGGGWTGGGSETAAERRSARSLATSPLPPAPGEGKRAAATGARLQRGCRAAAAGAADGAARAFGATRPCGRARGGGNSRGRLLSGPRRRRAAPAPLERQQSTSSACRVRGPVGVRSPASRLAASHAGHCNPPSPQARRVRNWAPVRTWSAMGPLLLPSREVLMPRSGRRCALRASFYARQGRRAAQRRPE
jgi:hypothetical protein